MPLSAPEAETYVRCASLSCLVGGVAFRIESGGFKPDYDVDEMTSNATNGFYEDGVTVQKCSLSLKLGLKQSAGTTGLVSGAVYPVLINVATMPTDLTAPLVGTGPGPALAGHFRLKLDAGNVLDVKANVHVSIEGMSQGIYAHVL